MNISIWFRKQKYAFLQLKSKNFIANAVTGLRDGSSYSSIEM